MSRHPESYARLAVRLRKARRRAGLTQIDVAEKLGIEQPHVSKIERGHRRIDPVEFAEMVRLYGADMVKLLDGLP